MAAKLPDEGCPNCERLQCEVAELKARVAKLDALLEQALRGGKRQAAPFSKGTPKKKPKRPGRKPGEEYGEHHRRTIPEQVDETYDVPLPDLLHEVGASCPKMDARGNDPCGAHYRDL